MASYDKFTGTRQNNHSSPQQDNNGILLPKLFWPAMTKKCSSDREKLLKETEGREFAKFLRSLGQFSQKVKGQNNFWYQNAFLTCSWRFLTSNTIERLFKLEKIFGIREPPRKVTKICLNLSLFE